MRNRVSNSFSYKKGHRTITPFIRKEAPNPQMPYKIPSLGLSKPPLFQSPTKTVQEKQHQNPNPHLQELDKGLTFIDNSRSSRITHALLEKMQRYEKIMDSFLTYTHTHPVFESIETILKENLYAENVIFWQDIPSLQVLYSSKLSKSIGHTEGIIGNTFFSRHTNIVNDPLSNNDYKPEVDGLGGPSNYPQMYFPLWDYTNSVCAVVQVFKAPANYFSSEDESFISYFVKKFKIYSRWLTTIEQPDQILLELLQLMEIDQFLLLFQKKVSILFQCETAEIWKHNTVTDELFKYNRSLVKMSNGLCGIIGEAFRKQLLINCDASKMRSSYYQSVDGDINESLLILPVLAGINDSDYAIVLKGKQNSSVFTQHDEQLLKKIAPYLVVSISNIEKHSTQNKTGQSNLNEHNCVQDLITIFDMILKNENPEKIVGNIMSKLEKVTTSDRCSLFIYNKKEKLLQTKYYSSLKDSITVPVDRGIVGATYRDSTIFNVPDSYEDPNFDSTIDLETGYKTKTLLSVPVKSIHDKNIGVIQLLNKLDGKPYSKLDIGFAKIYSQLSALILANYRNFTKLKKRTIQFHSLISDFHDNNIREEMKKIINLVQVSTNSEGSTLYLVDNILNVITTYVINGPKIPSTFPIPNSIAGHSIEIKKPILTNNPYREKVFNQSGDLNNGYKTKSLIAVPIFNTNNDDEPLAVLELVNKKVNNEYNQEDLKIAEKFAAFIGLRLENRKQKMIIEHGKAEVEMAKWIGEIERKSYIIPERLQIEPAKQNEILSINFFCVDWNGIGLFKVAFFAFNSFGLLEKYQIHNELFFVFLYTLKSYYNDVPYHNWIHAIDVLQYVVYQIHIAKLDSILTSNELLAICTAAICHDTNHSGLNNPYNQRAETPLGILYKDISVMEMHHCAMTIQILSQSNCNIFHAIPENDSIKIWHWIIQLILATDMAHHFKLLKNANDIMDQGPINLSNEMHRMMVMTMLIKIADISNVSRPFEIADRWCDILSEEFWRQGDLEKAHGWGVSSKLNDRDNVDKPNGQIGFYTFVCLPLYTAVARMLPELQVNADSVSANLEVWKEKAKEAEEEKAGVQSG